MTEQKQFNYFHRTPVQIRFNDIDKLDHVTNSVYMQYFDLGKLAYFNDILEEEKSWGDEGLVLANINIDYINSIKLFDDIEVRTKVIHLGNKSVRMVQEIYNKTTDKIAATSSSAMVGFNTREEIPIMIPERWRKRIIAYEHDTQFRDKDQ